MMMMNLLMLSVLMSWTSKSSNPVKTSISILMISLIIFFYAALETGTSWIPMLMLMLFMGGIIMMFMILSSILPNEKSKKIISPYVMTMTLLIMIMSSSWSIPQGGNLSSGMKSFLSSGVNFKLMMILILIYFIGCMSMLSAEQTPMRSLSCFYKINFVS